MSRVISCNRESQLSRASLPVASRFYTEHKKNEKMEPDKPTSLPPKKLRVLVVDDEKNIRTTLSLCLEQLGCAVTATATPEAALIALRSEERRVGNGGTSQTS